MANSIEQNIYNKIINYYINNENDTRFLLMKLPINNEPLILNEYLNNNNIIIPEINLSVKELFDNMKGTIECIQITTHSRCATNRVRDEHVFDNILSRDSAVGFIFKIINNKITDDDNRYIFNTILFILTHSHVFTNNIRYHCYNIIRKTNLLTIKQIKRINKDMNMYGVLYDDIQSEEDTDDEYNEFYTGSDSDMD